MLWFTLAAAWWVAVSHASGWKRPPNQTTWCSISPTFIVFNCWIRAQKSLIHCAAVKCGEYLYFLHCDGISCLVRESQSDRVSFVCFVLPKIIFYQSWNILRGIRLWNWARVWTYVKSYESVAVQNVSNRDHMAHTHRDCQSPLCHS